MSVKTMDQRLNGRFIQMSDVGCCLTRFVSHHECLRVYEAESVNDYLALD